MNRSLSHTDTSAVPLLLCVCVCIALVGNNWRVNITAQTVGKATERVK